MNAQATEEFRVRVNRVLIRKARRVAKEIGTTPGEVVRLLFAQMVKRRAIPFPLQADSAEEESIGPTRRRAELWDEMEQSPRHQELLKRIKRCGGPFLLCCPGPGRTL